MAAHIEWGSLSTTSSRSQGIEVGDPFGNPYSFADVDGVPYFYASGLDASIIDINAGADRVTLALSEAALQANNGTEVLSACEIGAGTFGDPENPPCARLVLSGKWEKVEDTKEVADAKAALFKRHPSFKLLPSGGFHNFFVGKIVLDGVWLIDFYGGPAIISPKDYFAANASASSKQHPTTTATSSSSLLATAPPAGPPSPKLPIATARWMVDAMNYGFLVTKSSRSDGSHIGDAFGNPYAFANVKGVPYFYGTDLDASMIDLFQGKSSRASFALSEASYPEAILNACKIGTLMGDPENPPCARLVLSGEMSKVKVNSTEDETAKAALFKKHPSFKNLPAGHGFYALKMEIDGIWLISHYGGAAIIKPDDYFKGVDAENDFKIVV